MINEIDEHENTLDGLSCLSLIDVDTIRPILNLKSFNENWLFYYWISEFYPITPINYCVTN